MDTYKTNSFFVEDGSMSISDIHDANNLADEHTIERHFLILGVSGSAVYQSDDVLLVINYDGAYLKNVPLPPYVYIGN